ncbi:hypothetical protein [Methylobacterium nonmethylotrophicum]|uniref:Uncharacterized protein n=1 Tax=Methylobacterium nonmethylotrophicum TaxID=1141884 RepID=A0A4Z0NDU5_9HYPH|nr:hypothetical protein [Methylobacterium nonmethylotrophicum]TGD94068.1 hypothetical protein EU555_32630 [Methylobacterium nonmethylotrophicum]
MKQLLWMCAQAYAVWWMTDGMIRDLGPQGAIGYLIMNVIIVAFLTALLTNVWDWVRARTRGLPFRLGFAVARLMGSVRHR